MYIVENNIIISINLSVIGNNVTSTFHQTDTHLQTENSKDD